MLRSKEMYLDMRMVQARLSQLDHSILPARIRRGLRAAGSKLMQDSVVGLPTMPIRRPGYPEGDSRVPGELRASGALFVDGVKKGNTMDYGEGATGKYQPHTYGGTAISKLGHEACVVFNAPYATIQHETFPNKTEQNANIHFMSDKLAMNGPEYVAIIARVIKL